jgi:hypothetical protein
MKCLTSHPVEERGRVHVSADASANKPKPAAITVHSPRVLRASGYSRCVAGADRQPRSARTTGGSQLPVREDSSRFGDAARTQAPGANPDVRANPVHLSVNRLEVGALNAFGLPVGVADLVLYDALLAADCTLSWHGCSKGAYL